MVMEASPSPQSVGREFVRQYYTLLNKAPAHLHRFYNNYSSFVHGGLDAPNRETLPVIGQKQIHNRIQQLNFRDCHAKISQVDAQATLGNGVVVQVTGELSNGGAPMRRFTQTFVLAAQSPKKYYVHNDIFRYQDIVFSDEEGEASGRSEGEEEESGSAGAAFFPPPPTGFPGAAFPQPPHHVPLMSPPAVNAVPELAPVPSSGAVPPGGMVPAVPAIPAVPAAPAPASVPAHILNGHPQQLEDSARHLVAALQVPGEEEAEPVLEGGSPPPAPEVASELEPEREPEPDSLPVSSPLPPEPKTYANLLKSGSSHAGNARGSPPSGPQLSVAAAHLPTYQPTHPAAILEQRPRMPRPAAPTGSGPAPASAPHTAEGGRRYCDSQQLFLGNLPHGATEEELRLLFGRFGPVADLRVHSKPAPPGAPKHPNYGFITYETAQAATDCLNAAPLYFPADSVDGVKLNVEEKKARGREPPRRRPLSSHRAAFQPRPAYRR